MDFNVNSGHSHGANHTNRQGNSNQLRGNGNSQTPKPLMEIPIRSPSAVPNPPPRHQLQSQVIPARHPLSGTDHQGYCTPIVRPAPFGYPSNHQQYQEFHPMSNYAQPSLGQTGSTNLRQLSGTSQDSLKAGMATFLDKEPVDFLQQLRPTTFIEVPTGSELVCLTVIVDGIQFEGYAPTKPEAKQKAAQAALKDLFNIICTKENESTIQEGVEKLPVEVCNKNQNNHSNFATGVQRGKKLNRQGPSLQGRRSTGRKFGSTFNISDDSKDSCKHLEAKSADDPQNLKIKRKFGSTPNLHNCGLSIADCGEHESYQKDSIFWESFERSVDNDVASEIDDEEERVFRFLVQECRGCISFDNFKRSYPSLPQNFDNWILGDHKTLALYKHQDKIVQIAPLFAKAYVCCKNFGFGAQKKCTSKNCSGFHVCKHYLNGSCKKGAKCEQGHSFNTGNNEILKSKLRLDSFSNEEIKTILQCRYPQVCLHSQYRCKDGENCPYLHICYNFIRDICKDSICRRGHSFETPHNLWVLSVFKMEQWPKQKMALLKALVSMPRKRIDSRSRDDDTSSNTDFGESASHMSLFAEENDESECNDSSNGIRDDGESKENIQVKSRPGRKNRWAQPIEDTEFISAVTASKTQASVQKKSKATENINICLKNLIGACKERCDMHHTPLPYLWQIKLYGEWISFNNGENQRIEERFCQLTNSADTEAKHDGRRYKIRISFPENFGMFYEIDGEPFNGIERHVIRRLSTKSFASEKKTPTSGTFHTQWRWYHKDVSQRPILYPGDAFQITLEQKFLSGQKTYIFTEDSHRVRYQINFTNFQQKNVETLAVDTIKRVPLFVSLADVMAKNFPKYLPIPRLSPRPVGWVPWDTAHDFELVEIEESNKTFKTVKSTFFETMKEDVFQIENIYRIQNEALWGEYKMKKMNMERDLKIQNSSVDERTLYHGTDSINTCYGICTNNFDFRLSGRNATMYGKGSYFATTAKYSNSYTVGPRRLLFQAKVLVGRYTMGADNMTCPPVIPNEGHKRYDSCVDNVVNPTIFVVFDRNQSYPEYLIEYKEK